MLESLQQFLLFGSYIWFWVAVGLLVISFFISDLEEQGYGAFFSFLLFLGITYFWSNFNIFNYISWGQVLFYLLVGFTYSFVRTFFYAKNMVKMEDNI